jgi:hypothetical protein
VCSVTRGLMIRAWRRCSHERPPVGPWPGGVSPPPPPGPPRHRSGWRVVALLLAAVAGSTVTYLAVDGHGPASTPAMSQTATPLSALPTPQFSPAEADTAKQRLCQVFDVSVRGQEGQGGLRVEGNLNVPVTLRAVNSATAVQNALVPAVPPDVASAARKYISTTLDTTTAVMGTPPATEVNRLTDRRNDATDSLLYVCGLPQ